MVLSDVSIKRPVFATVISLLLTVLGLFALFRMPIREYPAIDPPIIQIITTYTGDDYQPWFPALRYAGVAAVLALLLTRMVFRRLVGLALAAVGAGMDVG